MSKRPGLFAKPAVPPTAPEPVIPAPAPAEAASSGKHPVAKTRAGKRNATVYLDPEAATQLKMIAVREDATIQDLLVEGINEVFAKRGMSRIA